MKLFSKFFTYNQENTKQLINLRNQIGYLTKILGNFIFVA
ncbi:hypothetical protein BN424_3023 [Carnobacterium maltaromaticum LMA28]|uniref:Uncharacterized protein n=1 Tax=Carnobacterium maltaromaticum LMA28 TaxID=1234679 RepID=K8E6Z6_CARML|nr:hypothetical protein BN424_3023 [Carnobacterium maltaromaticum LMA28]